MKGSLRAAAAMVAMFVGGILLATSFSTGDLATALFGIVVSVAGFVLFGRGFSRARGGGRREYVALDLIAVVLVGVFFATFLVGALSGLLGNDQQSQNVAHFLLEMEFGGLLMALVSKVLVLSGPAGVAAFRKQVLYISVNFGAFFVLNLLVPPAAYRFLGLSSLAPSNPFVTVMISVPEETVFHVWLAPWLANLSRTGPIGGSFMQAVVATAYHLFVLGTQPAKLGIVFGAFFATGFTAMQSRLASTTMTNHLANNFLSVMTGI